MLCWAKNRRCELSRVTSPLDMRQVDYVRLRESFSTDTYNRKRALRKSNAGRHKSTKVYSHFEITGGPCNLIGSL